MLKVTVLPCLPVEKNKKHGGKSWPPMQPKHDYYTGKKKMESPFFGGGADLLFTQRFPKVNRFIP